MQYFIWIENIKAKTYLLKINLLVICSDAALQLLSLKLVCNLKYMKK